MRDLSEKAKKFEENQAAETKCLEDLSNLRNKMEAQRLKEEDKFFGFQQKYQHSQLGTEMVDLLDIFRQVQLTTAKHFMTNVLFLFDFAFYLDSAGQT